MADIKKIEIIPDSGSLGTKTLFFTDTPEALDVKIKSDRPIAVDRTDNGALIAQTFDYDKKNIAITGIIYDVLNHIYFESLLASGVTATLKVYYEDNNFAEQTEFDGSVSFIDYDPNADKINNKRTFLLLFMEN